MLYSFILACGVHRDNVLCPFMNNGNKNCIMIKSTYFQVTETVYHYSYKVFIYLGFYVAFNTVQVISRWVVERAEETST